MLLAQLHLQRADYAESRRWASRGLEIAEQIGNFAGLQRARALLLASRVVARRAVTVGTLGDLLEEGIQRGGNAIVSIQPIVDAFLALGELGRAERVARVAHERAAGRYRQLLAGAALADVLVRLGASAPGRSRSASSTAAWASPRRSAPAPSRPSCQSRAARLALDRELPHDARRRSSGRATLCAAIGLVRFAGSIPMLMAQARTAGHRRRRR